MELSTATPNPLLRSSPRVGPLHAVAAVLLVVGVIVIVRTLAAAPRSIDFSHYYVTANILLSGEDPYSEPLLPHCERLGVQYDARIPIGAHPPLLLRVFSWFCWLPLQQAFAVWAIVQAACLFVMVETTRRIVRFKPGSPVGVLFVAMVVCSTTTQSHWQYSQVQLLVGALVVAGYAAHLGKRHVWACGLAAFAAFFKLYPLLLLPWFVTANANGYRDVARRLAAIAAVAAAVLAITGFDAWFGFFDRGVPVIREAGTSLSNFSLQTVSSRVLQSLLAAVLPEFGDRIAHLAAAGLAGLAILIAFLCVWRRPLAEHVPICLLTTVMIFAGPVAWAHYMVLMILPVAVLLQHADRFKNRWVRLACPIVAVMCLMPNIDLFLLSNGDAAWRLAIHFYPLYALLAAAALLIAVPASPRAAPAAA